VDTILGLLGLVVFSICVVTFAAAMTWIVVKVSPAPNKQRSDTQTEG
jgi:hypothetical protein